MKDKTCIVRFLIASLGVALLFAGCSDDSRPQGRAVQQGTLERGSGAFPVEVIEAQERDVVDWIRGIGSVRADKHVTLSAEVGGKVSDVLVDVGDRVAKGELLARLDDERYRIARALAQAEVEIAKANLEDSKRDAERQADLYADGVISEDAVEEADLNVRVNAGQLEMALAKLAATERDLSDTTITSPIQGETTKKYIEVGELLQPGAPLFDIADIRLVKIAVQASELDITKISEGQAAEISVDGYPGIGFHGEVHTIGTEADTQTRTFPVEILVDNDRPEKLLPGFIGRVRIRGKTFENAIMVPQETVVNRDGRPTVFVAASDTASARTVELGFTDRGMVLVSNGLEAGDKIIVTGQEALQDGSRILVR